MLSVIKNYTVLLHLWTDSLTSVKNTVMRARIIGVSARMETFDFFFGITLGELILRHSDNLSRTLHINLSRTLHSDNLSRTLHIFE